MKHYTKIIINTKNIDRLKKTGKVVGVGLVGALAMTGIISNEIYFLLPEEKILSLPGDDVIPKRLNIISKDRRIIINDEKQINIEPSQNNIKALSYDKIETKQYQKTQKTIINILPVEETNIVKSINTNIHYQRNYLDYKTFKNIMVNGPLDVNEKTIDLQIQRLNGLIINVYPRHIDAARPDEAEFHKIFNLYSMVRMYLLDTMKNEDPHVKNYVHNWLNNTRSNLQKISPNTFVFASNDLYKLPVEVNKAIEAPLEISPENPPTPQISPAQLFDETTLNTNQQNNTNPNTITSSNTENEESNTNITQSNIKKRNLIMSEPEDSIEDMQRKQIQNNVEKDDELLILKELQNKYPRLTREEEISQLSNINNLVEEHTQRQLLRKQAKQLQLDMLNELKTIKSEYEIGLIALEDFRSARKEISNNLNSINETLNQVEKNVVTIKNKFQLAWENFKESCFSLSRFKKALMITGAVFISYSVIKYNIIPMLFNTFITNIKKDPYTNVANVPIKPGIQLPKLQEVGSTVVQVGAGVLLAILTKGRRIK